ncbi:FtsH protease regulator HflC [compost metagenome]
MPLDRVFEAIDSLGPFWSTVAYAVILAGAAFLAYIKTFKLVEQGNQAIRLNRGKVARDKHGNVIILGPGLKMMIPFWQTIKIVSVLDRTIDLETVPVRGKGKFEAYNIRATLTVSISSIFYWLYGAETIDARVRAIAQELLIQHFSVLIRKAAGDNVEVQALELFENGGRQAFIESLSHRLKTSELGGVGKDLNITLLMPAYEGWTPQALSTIGGAIKSNGFDLSFKTVAGRIARLFRI